MRGKSCRICPAFVTWAGRGSVCFFPLPQGQGSLRPVEARACSQAASSAAIRAMTHWPERARGVTPRPSSALDDRCGGRMPCSPRRVAESRFTFRCGQDTILGASPVADEAYVTAHTLCG